MTKRVDVVVLTVIQVELDAARSALEIDDRERETADDGTVYFRGMVRSELARRNYNIVLACVGGAGNPGAAVATASAIARYRPRVVVLMGIAAGMRGKTRIGDVVVAERVVAYEPAALMRTADGPLMQPRPEIDRVPHAMSQAFVTYRADANRLREKFVRAGGKFPTVPTGREDEFRQHVASSIGVRLATVASGEKLLRDPEEFSALRDGMHGKTEAGEMEAVGVVEACRRANVPWMVFRGISDFGDEFKDDQFHGFAALTAAAAIVDFMAWGLDLGAELAADLVRHWSRHQGATYSPERREARRIEFETNFVAALKLEVEELREAIEDLETRLEEQHNDAQFMTLWSNLGYEAAREALDERRRMLEHAAAGLIDPRLSIEDKARVERTLRQLDPTDVRTLYGLHRVVDRRPERKRHELWTDAGMSGEVLLSTGCVKEDLHAGAAGGAPPDLHLTRLGELILRTLRSYVLERGAPFDIPGRTPEPSHRGKQEVFEYLSRVPELIDFLSWAKNTSHIGKQFLRMGEATATTVAVGAPPYPYIRFNIFDLGQRELCDTVSRKLHETELSFVIQSEADWGEPMFVAFLTGPEDVLWLVADFVDAHWIIV